MNRISRRRLISPRVLTRPRSAQDTDPLLGADPIAVVIPPVDATIQTTACAFCIVGCGYRVYSWPVGQEGGPVAEDNALGVDFPAITGRHWISPSMHNIVLRDGAPHHVVVLPEPAAEVVNLNGDHSLGGMLARRLYSPYAPATSERFLSPMLRVDGELRAIPWEAALEIVARLSRHVIDQHGELAWGMKTYSYQFYENTFAITKLAFVGVGTPCWAPHDQPAAGSSTPGLSDAGINAFSANYEDWRDAEVVFVSGVSLYATKAVLFSQWVKAGGAQLIVVNVRRDETADFVLREERGLFLQVKPGTDTILHNAIARVILERGWEDSEFIEQFTVNDPDTLAAEQDGNWRRTRFAMTFDGWSEFILGDPTYTLEVASALTGVDAEQIVAAARALAEPASDGARTRASFMLEKGNYWGHNYPGSASLASLGLLCGAGNRQGRVISRAGGHQRGMVAAASYPIEKSINIVDGNTLPMNVDEWCRAGNLRMAWAIGCTWAGGGSAGVSTLYSALKAYTSVGPLLTQSLVSPEGTQGEIDVDAVVAALAARADAGGTVLVQSDLYAQSLTDLADIVLPAASWGEEDFSRMQGERRLRAYPRIADPPGECRPDWKIVADVARRMGYSGFDWETSQDVFIEAASRTERRSNDYLQLVKRAQELSLSPYEELLRAGTKGYQCPIRRSGDELVETPRYHDAETGRGFASSSELAMFVRGDWADAESRQRVLEPRADELWIVNRRDSRTWSAMIEDKRIPVRIEQMSEHRLEVHPEDLEARELAHGDHVKVCWVDDESRAFHAVVEASDRMRPRVACAYFNYTGQIEFAANAVTSENPDSINGMYSFKLGRGILKRIDD